MLSKTEDVHLLLLIVPVTPDAFKESGAVVESMGHNPNFGLG
jgi:hypothetical protein